MSADFVAYSYQAETDNLHRQLADPWSDQRKVFLATNIF